MFASFHTGSPAALAGYSNADLDRMLERARVTADMRSRNADYCEIGRHINQQAIWFWTFQNTYYAIAKAKVKGVPPLFSGIIDVSDAWLE
jgi:4-phytase/acid phosphatase/peptide/nickel transport system substrate-binding protein